MSGSKVIVIANGKGGVGKSFTAAHVVVDLIDRGIPTVLIDGEKDCWPTAKRLSAFDQSIPIYPISSMDECRDAVKRSVEGQFSAVVDWAGELTEEVAQLTAFSDLFIVPFIFGEQEYIQTVDTLTLLRAQQLLRNGKPEAWVFLNKTRKRDASVNKYRDMLSPLGIPIAQTRLRALDEYRDFRCVLRDPALDKNKAATDFRQLMDEIVMPQFMELAANE